MATIGVSGSIGSVGASAAPDVGYASAFMVGVAPWGEVNVVKMCTSLGQFQRLFGGLNKASTVAADGAADTWTTETTSAAQQTYYAVKGYFDEKGNAPNGVLYFCRVVKSGAYLVGATAATRNFPDGTTNNTVVISKWPGTPGGTTTVQIDTPSPDKGTGWAKFTIVNSKANITEYYNIATAADAADASKNSELVTIALPAGLELPVTCTASKLYNGTPGVADAYNATDANHVGVETSGAKTGLGVFSDQRYGTGFVSIPGKYSSAIRAGIKAHVEKWYRIGILSSPSGKTVSNVAADISGTNGSYMGYYWPQLWVADSNSDSGGKLLIDNTGHIAGLWANLAHQYGGPHKSPAGLTHSFATVLDVERQSNGEELCDDAGSNTLADSFVNTIRMKGNPPGVCVWGLRTLAQDNRFRQIQAVLTICLSYLTVYLIAEAAVFEPIDSDGQLFSKVKGTCDSFFAGLRRAGAVFGDYPGDDPKKSDAYRVICDRSNNTDRTIDAGELHVDCYMVPTKNAESVKFSIQVTAPGSSPSK